MRSVRTRVLPLPGPAMISQGPMPQHTASRWEGSRFEYIELEDGTLEITGYTGNDEVVVIPDFFEIDVEPGSHLLLCSDGLSNMIQDDELYSIVNSDRVIDDKVKYLIDRANYYGGYDNIAAVLVTNEG